MGSIPLAAESLCKLTWESMLEIVKREVRIEETVIQVKIELVDEE